MRIPFSFRVLTLTLLLAIYVPCLGALTIINSHGEQLETLFDGVSLRQPSASASKTSCKNGQRPFVSSDVLSQVPGQAKLKTAACDPGNCCVGHFEVVIPIQGGCYMNACPVKNSEENTIIADYEDGVWPYQCSQYCCDTVRFCFNDGEGCL